VIQTTPQSSDRSMKDSEKEVALASVESLGADVNTFSVVLAFVILSESDRAPSMVASHRLPDSLGKHGFGLSSGEVYA